MSEHKKKLYKVYIEEINNCDDFLKHAEKGGRYILAENLYQAFMNFKYAPLETVSYELEPGKFVNVEQRNVFDIKNGPVCQPIDVGSQQQFLIDISPYSPKAIHKAIEIIVKYAEDKEVGTGDLYDEFYEYLKEHRKLYIDDELIKLVEYFIQSKESQ